MESWNLREIPTPDGTRSPVVLHSTDEARAVLLGVEPGQELGEHQVKEDAWLVVVDGEVRVTAADGAAVDAGPGMLIRFERDERRTIASPGGARILLLFAPWPGPGHYRGGQRAPADS